MANWRSNHQASRAQLDDTGRRPSPSAELHAQLSRSDTMSDRSITRALHLPCRIACMLQPRRRRHSRGQRSSSDSKPLHASPESEWPPATICTFAALGTAVHATPGLHETHALRQRSKAKHMRCISRRDRDKDAQPPPPCITSHVDHYTVWAETSGTMCCCYQATQTNSSSHWLTSNEPAMGWEAPHPFNSPQTL